MKNKGRPIDGLLLLNKPLGDSSNQILQKVKHLFHARKAGHGGTLDPLATGLLPICFGQASKYIQFFLNADKSYVAIGQLGVTTTTGDSEGDIIEEKLVIANEMQVLKALEQFKGKILQTPPMYSALKHKGQPLYKLAREGKEVEREAREVFIHKLELLNFDGVNFEIEVTCSKGTYIRTLVEDIGKALSVGAHVSKLHRTQISGLDSQKAVDFKTLETLKEKKAFEEMEQYLLPIEEALAHLPLIDVDLRGTEALYHGKTIYCDPDLVGFVKLNSPTGFIGIGEVISASILKAKRLMSVS